MPQQPAARPALAACALLAALAAGCPGSSPPPPPDPGPPRTLRDEAAGGAGVEHDLDVPTVRYEWDPSAGDPSVPAELGGPGFTGEGWTTNMEFPALGSSEAVRGGSMTRMLSDWPATFRQTGKDWNESFNYQVHDLCYPGLLGLHQTTLEYIPGLATHWQVSEDKRTYRFRINPEARWSDETEVTADDVVATFRLRMDPTTLDPSSQLTFGKMHEPVALSKYVVEVKVKEENWRNLLYFGHSMAIFPAAEVSIPGGEYLKRYQFDYTASSGPYRVDMDSVVTGQEITVRRRDDYWDDGNPAWVGLHNIDAFRFVVVKDWNLAFEKAKKGELDYFAIPKAQWWAEELDGLDAVRRGLLLKAKFYTDDPIGTSGIAIHVRRPPLDDRRVRLALQLLMDRDTLIRQLFFDEYEPLTSYFQGGTYANPDNEEFPYDPFRAVELLEEAGWTETNSEGYRVRDGRELRFSLIYRSALSERSLTVYQEACRDAGIRLELQLLTPAALWKTIRQKDYDLASMNWGGLVFPNPETTWHSSLAEQVDNNNIVAFADERVDALCEAYDREYDPKRRIEIVREIDGILYEAIPYVLEWYNPAQRVVVRNKFSWPRWGSLRTGDQEDSLYYVWWVDPEKERALQEAKEDPSRTLPKPPVHHRFWQAWAEAQRQAD